MAAQLVGRVMTTTMERKKWLYYSTVASILARASVLVDRAEAAVELSGKIVLLCMRENRSHLPFFYRISLLCPAVCRNAIVLADQTVWYIGTAIARIYEIGRASCRERVYVLV